MDLRQLRRPIHLILDWDGTLTRKDTLSLVGQIAYHANKSSSSLPPWSDFVTGYGNDYTRHLSQYEPKASARTTLDQERQWLASLTPVENQSVRRVESSGIFRGVTSRHVEHVARKSLKTGDLQLRSQWDVFLQSLLASSHGLPNKVSILSVNWSESFIRQSLLAAAHGSSVSGQKTLTSYIETMEIRANEITGLESPEGSDGTLNKNTSAGIRTGADKLANMPDSCRSKLDSPGTKRNNDDYTVIYVGDSATDLEALLAADVGICIRDDPIGGSQRELAEILERIGVQVVSIEDGVPATKTADRTVYFASGYEQITRALTIA